MSKIERKGRTLAKVVDELLESKRLEIAVRNFQWDKSLLRCLLIDLNLETTNVVRNTIIKHYNTHSSLAAFELSPYLRSINEFNSYGILGDLSPLEQKLYCADPKNRLSDEEYKVVFEKFKKEMMGS